MNTKLKCLLLDDELPGLTYLKMMCEQINGVEVIKAFNDPLKLLEEAKSLDFDVCILDIEMPGMSGLEVANALKDKAIIFTTAYKEFAAEAYDLDAIDYIRKPVQKERLEKALEKAAASIAKTNPPKEYIQLNSNKGKTLLYFKQLLYITTSEIDKRDKVAYLDDGQQVVLKNISFEQLLLSLPAAEFCRINKKELIRISCVNFFNHDTIQTNINDALGHKLKLTLSDVYRKEFIQKTTL